MSPKRQRRGPKAEPQILDFAARVPLPRIPPKCRLPKSALEKGAIALNSWVRVDRPLANGGSESYLAIAWPGDTEYTTAEVDTLVCIPSSVVDPQLGIGSCSVAPLAPKLEHAVKVTVIAKLTDSDQFFAKRGYRWESASETKRVEEVSSTLRGLVIAEGARIGLGTSLNISINSLSPPSPYLSIGSDTCFEFADDNVAQQSTAMEPEQPTSSTPSGPPGGLAEPYERLMEVVRYPFLFADRLAALNLDAPKGVLLYGPPGVGKTLLVRTVARQVGANLVVINGAEIASPHVGQGEAALDERFAKAAGSETPGIVFIDEIDALAPPREQASSTTLRLISHLAYLMDSLRTDPSMANVVVIAATNRPGGIDPSLRRSGRFDREIGIDPPGISARIEILGGLAEGKVDTADDVDLRAVAESTPGFVGADLENLVREACGIALRRAVEAPAPPDGPPSDAARVRMADFTAALKAIGPSSAARGWTVDVGQKRGWDSVGGLESVKRKLRQAVEWPILHRDTFERLGLRPPRGVLLYGPPGCSKTTLAKVVAGTAGLNFASLDVAGLYSSFVGDSERIVREAFSKARATVPCVLFLDEVDALAGTRDGKEGNSSSSDTVQSKILSSLLNEMDGIEAANGILVVGATNRPWSVDSALLRPGRFDRLVHVPPPDLQGRKKILEIYTRGMPLASDVDLAEVAERLLQGDLWSGADLENICREAALGALRRGMREESSDRVRVTTSDFQTAAASAKPSLAKAQLARYERFEAGGAVD